MEDDVHLQRALGRLVTQLGYEPMPASSAREAVDLLGDGTGFEAILLDLRLPDLSGNALLRQLRRAQIGTPVIVMSGVATMEDVVRAVRERACDFLQKPFDLEDLSSALDRAAALAGAAPAPGGPGLSMPTSALLSEAEARRATPPTSRLSQEGPAASPESPPSPPVATQERPVGPIRPVIARLRDRLATGEIRFPVLDPKVIVLHELLGRADVSVDEVVAAIGRDPALVASVLRTANSPYYRRGAETKSLREACVRLGTKRVLALAIEAAVNDSLPTSHRRYARLLDRMWRSAVVTSRVAALLAGQLRRRDVEFVQVVALLHDLGETMVVQLLGELDPAGELPDDQVAAEVTRLHEDFGRALLKAWGLPRVFWQLAGHHHRAPGPAEDREMRELRLLVLAAWKLGNLAGHAVFPGREGEDPGPEVAALGLDPARSDELMRQATSWDI